MEEQVVMDFVREAIYTVIISAAPLLLTALIVGLTVSIFQTITSIQEQTLAFIPKILSVFAALLMFGSFIGRNVMDFFVHAMNNINTFIR